LKAQVIVKKEALRHSVTYLKNTGGDRNALAIKDTRVGEIKRSRDEATRSKRQKHGRDISMYFGIIHRSVVTNLCRHAPSSKV
jgi:hypothetical protein